MTDYQILQWFEAGVFKRIFFDDRLSKFHRQATAPLKFVNFTTWSAHANDVSKHAVVDIFNFRDREVELFSDTRKDCSHCGYYGFKIRYSRFHSASYHCLRCKRHSWSTNLVFFNIRNYLVFNPGILVFVYCYYFLQSILEIWPELFLHLLKNKHITTYLLFFSLFFCLVIDLACSCHMCMLFLLLWLFE